ncbi:hypothetical protein TI83_04235 [Rathayibacter toxicus]|nr:hypothetical protein TI83_04235 [Rathayibacter toxicus]PPI24038.1 hypothetical protein C5D55_04070 [Rathayibacter toxicus]
MKLLTDKSLALFLVELQVSMVPFPGKLFVSHLPFGLIEFRLGCFKRGSRACGAVGENYLLLLVGTISRSVSG